MSIPSKIEQLPLGVIKRMKLRRFYSQTVSPLKKVLGRETYNYYPMVVNNLLYGDEFLLRKYGNIRTSEALYSIIEHGLFLGRNHAKVGPNKYEWDLGSVLTSSIYRKETINEFFPEHYCETIGPMIHYANIDEEFQSELQKRIDSQSKTMLFYPAHSTIEVDMVYEIEKTISELNCLANENNCNNIIICAGYYDIKKYQSVDYKCHCKGKNVIVTTNGMIYDTRFLDRQKTMIGLADITVSNALGTHVGYCVYLGKPHVILQQEIEHKGAGGNAEFLKREFDSSNRSPNWAEDYAKEKKMFSEMFANRTPQIITEEQKKTCTYYWGFDQVKTSEQIREIWDICKSKSVAYTKRHNV